MAQKEVAIKIKIDGKELDAAKLSVNEFEKIYSDAASKLKTLPLGSEEWKKLNQEVKNSEQAFQQTKEIAGETEGKFKSLRLQIRQATVAFQEAEDKGDLKGMKIAKKNLEDLNDQFEVTTLKSMEFKDALAKMPGVAGLVGQSIQGIDMAFKVLVANPILATITAIVGAFMFLKESLSKTTEGQEALNKVSQAFSKIMGPILALINMVAIPIFEKLADIIGAVGSAFAFFAEKLGVSKKSIAQATKDVDEVGKVAAENEKKRQEEAQKKEEERAKKAEEAVQKAKELAAARKKLAQDTINTNEALVQSENELANASIKKSEDVIEALKQEQSFKDESLSREKKRIDDLMKLERVGSDEYKKLQTEKNSLDAEYAADKIEREQAINEELKNRLEKEAEFIKKVREYKIAAIEDETFVILSFNTLPTYWLTVT
jgi:chromosome segregation ATPase